MKPGYDTSTRAGRTVLKLARLVALGVLACMGLSLAFNGWLFKGAPPEVFAKGMVAAIVLPLGLAGPLFLYLSVKLRQLSDLNHELRRAAGLDSLTQILNRGAFTGIVGTKLDDMLESQVGRGALMIIDADFFKTINDRWGHTVGDQALRLIAAQLKSVVRRDDVVGRLGGEEFGVFLYGSGVVAARSAAERVRTLVEAIDLRTAEGEPIHLSISVGAIHFREALPFSTLYQIADRKLYEAKANGRNRVEFEELRAEVYVEAAA